MDMMKIEFDSLVKSAEAVRTNIDRFLKQGKGASYAKVASKSVELLIEDMREFREKYIEKEDNDG